MAQALAGQTLADLRAGDRILTRGAISYRPPRRVVAPLTPLFVDSPVLGVRLVNPAPESRPEYVLYSAEVGNLHMAIECDETQPAYGWTDNGYRLDNYNDATAYYMGVGECPTCGRGECLGIVDQCSLADCLSLACQECGTEPGEVCRPYGTGWPER